MLKNYWYILFLLFLSSLVTAQVPGDSLSFITSRFSSPQLSSNFEKQLNTYNLFQNFNYGTQFGKTFIGVNQSFRSTVIRSGTISIRDESFLSFLGQYDFSRFVSAGAHVNYNVYTDDKKLAINSSSVFNSTVFTKFNPIAGLSITPYGGLSQNEQIGITDRGAIYGAEALLNNVNVSEFNLYSAMKFQNEDISPRKNTLRNFKFNIDKTFENSFRNQLLGLYSEQRKDFYFNADSLIMDDFDVEKNIQSRIEKRVSIADRVNVTTSVPGLIFFVEGSAAWRTIDRDTRYVAMSNITTSSFDTKIDEFKISLKPSLRYVRNNFNGILRINFSERDEKHNAKYIDGASEIIYRLRQEQEKRKNNIGKQTTISMLGNYYITPIDQISISLFHRKLTYDTPSELNNDDRDELLSMFSLEYRRRLTPFFNLFANLNGSINKVVYIFKERSANNNTLRVAKLSSGGYLDLGYLTSRNEAEVSANYTVYEFEDLNPNLKSFSFRQLVLRDSTSLKLFRSNYFRFLGYMKFSEQGDFNWNGFANNPVRYLDERYAEPTFEYRYKHLSFAFGLRYFSITTFIYDEDNQKRMKSYYRSTAPLSIISYRISSSIQINIRGWYEFIRTESNIDQELVNLFFRVIWNI
ncbi:MAG: hypothetical protein GXO85_04060 [Chlorobi bacterium]|nr:hypothetical protein [Chlorobiota bacterium]